MHVRCENGDVEKMSEMANVEVKSQTEDDKLELLERAENPGRIEQIW